MPTYTMHDGTVVRHGTPYDLTRLDDISVPDLSYWFAHPYYLAQVQDRLGISTPLTYGQLQDYLNKNKKRYTSSSYWEYMSDSIEAVWSESPLLGGDSWVRNGLDSDPVLEVNPADEPSGLQIVPVPPGPRVIELAYIAKHHNKLIVHGEDSGRQRPQMDHWPTWGGRVKNYTFTPELVFTPEFNPNNLYFGLELEVSTALSPYEFHYVMAEVEPKQPLFAFLKSDVSISGRYQNHYEIVTMPMSPREQRKQWRIFFRKLEKLVSEQGYTMADVFDLSPDLSNGLHIHLSRCAFTSEARGTREWHLNRFMTAFNQWDRNFQEWLTRLAKRPCAPGDSEYYRPHGEMVGRTLPRRLMRNYRHDRNSRRSVAHVTDKTCEVRVYQGIPTLEHILSCLDITEAMFYFTRRAPLSAYSRNFTTHFTEWVIKQPNFRNAKKVLLECA